MPYAETNHWITAYRTAAHEIMTVSKKLRRKCKKRAKEITLRTRLKLGKHLLYFFSLGNEFRDKALLSYACPLVQGSVGDNNLKSTVQQNTLQT